MWSTLENILCALEKKVYSAYGSNVLCQVHLVRCVISIWINHPFVWVGCEVPCYYCAAVSLPLFYIYYFFFFFRFFFNWSKISLKCCANFWHATTQFNKDYTDMTTLFTLPDFCPSHPSLSSESTRLGSCFI